MFPCSPDLHPEHPQTIFCCRFLPLRDAFSANSLEAACNLSSVLSILRANCSHLTHFFGCQGRVERIETSSFNNSLHLGENIFVSYYTITTRTILLLNTFANKNIFILKCDCTTAAVLLRLCSCCKWRCDCDVEIPAQLTSCLVDNHHEIL